MRFVVLGTSDFTIACASTLLECGAEVAALVSMPLEALPNNSADLRGFAARHRIPYHECADLNTPESRELLAGHRPDYLFSSWPRIIGPEVLALPRYCTIGTHPTELPRNRGRHPLHWLIALGISQSRLSFFRMDQGIDTGTILHQEPFAIEDEDEIGTLVQRVNRLACRGTSALYQLLLRDPDPPGTSQDESRASSWRKRSPHDSLIDPRLTVASIVRGVRCFAPPYPGASLIVKDQVLRVARARQTDRSSQFPDTEQLEPGRVLAVGEREITFRAADGVVTLTCLDPIPDVARLVQYIHPPSKYLCSHPELAGRL